MALENSFQNTGLLTPWGVGHCNGVTSPKRVAACPCPPACPKMAALAAGVFAHHSVCLVLDYGSQYTQLIARRVRDNGVLSMLMPGDVTLVRLLRQCMHAGRGGVGVACVP